MIALLMYYNMQGVSLEDEDKLFMGSWSQRMKLCDLLLCKRLIN